MLPRKEKKTYLWAVIEAVDLAGAGEPTMGYARLLAGLRRAEALQRSGVSWAGELVRCWREAIEKFAVRYGGE